MYIQLAIVPIGKNQHKPSDSGNIHEKPKCKGHPEVTLGPKDADMRSDSSDSCTKEVILFILTSN